MICAIVRTDGIFTASLFVFAQLWSVHPLPKPIKLKTARRKDPDGKRDGETSLKREHDSPHKHASAQGRNQPTQHDEPSSDIPEREAPITT